MPNCNAHGNASLHARELGVCRCDCTFVDVGLNDGHSLLRWPHIAWQQLNRSKTTRSRTLGAMRSCFEHQRTTCYYGFEANPKYNAQLARLEQRLRKYLRAPPVRGCYFLLRVTVTYIR